MITAERWEEMRDRENVDPQSKARDRVVDGGDGANTGRKILRELARIPELSWEDARVMVEIVMEDRESDTRDQYDLR